MLQGCKSGSEDNKPASQVAARVNGGEITIYRVNTALGALTANGNVDPKKLGETKRNVLNSLVDQELAAQAAESAKLDRTPAVVQAVEAARREVLARAWLEQLSQKQPKPDAAEVTKYYAAHPELFAERRLYQVQQLVLAAPEPELLAEARQKIQANMTLQQIASWLDEKKVKYAASTGARAAEQIPLDVLPTIAKAKDGETLLIEQPKAAMIVHLVTSISQPMDEATAAPRIRKYLTNVAWTTTVGDEMKRLKDSASITYLGEFAAAGEAKPASQQAQQQAPQQQASATSPKQEQKASNPDMSALYKEVAR